MQLFANNTEVRDFVFTFYTDDISEKAIRRSGSTTTAVRDALTWWIDSDKPILKRVDSGLVKRRTVRITSREYDGILNYATEWYMTPSGFMRSVLCAWYDFVSARN